MTGIGPDGMARRINRQSLVRGLPLLCILIFPAILCMGRAVPASAQFLEDEPIVSVEINSKVGMTIESLSRLTGIRTGLNYSRKVIRQSLDALYATNLFTDVIVEVSSVEGGVAVVYNLIEKAVLSELRFRPFWLWRMFSDRTLTEAMGLQVGDEFTDDKWKASLERLMNFLQRNGYLQARVDTAVEEIAGTTQVRVTVNVREGTRAKIRDLRIVGRPYFSDLRLMYWELSRSGTGEYYNADILEEDLKDLETLYIQNGFLDAIVGPAEITVDDTANEVLLTLPIEAGTRLIVGYEGQGDVKDDQLRPLLMFYEQRSFDDSIFRASADRIAGFYRSRGYPFAKVDYRRKDKPDTEEVSALFQINHGPYACLNPVLFVGNTHFSSARLQSVIQTYPSSLLSCTVAEPEILGQDVKTLRQKYLEQGFQSIKIEPRIEYSEKKDRVYLLFAVAEGPRTIIEDIQFEGRTVIDARSLMKVSRLRPGKPFDTVPLRQDQEEFLLLYSQIGRVYAEITPGLDYSEDRMRVSIRYRIDEGPRVEIGRILLSGNTFTLDDVILRELQVKTGDPYDETKIQISRRRIQQLGFVGNVRFEPIAPISRDTMETVKDMRLTVQERPKKTMDLGIGFATEERLRGFIQGTHRNLGGSGRSLTLRAEGSTLENRYSVTYREPWALGFQMDGRLVGFHQTLVRPTYNLVTRGGTAGLDKNLTPSLKASLQYQYEQNWYKKGVELLKEDERANIGSLNPALFWDTRDDPFNPTSGFLQAVTFRDAAMIFGSQVQFIRTALQSNWYIPVTRWMVLALSARGGMADRFGQTQKIAVFGETDLVPPSERFYLGGQNTVRGYNQDSLGIPNKTLLAKSDGSDVEFSGGNAMLVFNGELRLFLPGGLGLVVFNDRGNVFRVHRDVDLNLLKSTVGAGIWFATPVGPFRLDYGYKLDRERFLCIVPTGDPQRPYRIDKVPAGCGAPFEESRSEIHFTLGFAF